MNAICLVIDRLQAGYLGCYGNAWVGTPGFDRLAAESFVLDGAYIDSPELESLYRSYWLGSHALARCGAGQGNVGRISNPSDALPRRVSAAGASTALVTDGADVARHPLAAHFDQLLEVPTHWPRRAAAEFEDTHAARFFAAAMDALREAKPPFLLWLHSQGMAGPWDAPRELHQRYVAEGDPEPPDFVRPPGTRLPADPDPDELLGIRQAYAAQVAVIDACVEMLHNALRESCWAEDTLLVVLSARGFPLGVHGIVGQAPCRPDGPEADLASGQAENLHGELTSIPWLLRFPDGLGAADRSPAFAQPADLCDTLVDWLRGSPGSPREVGHGQAFLSAGQTGVPVLAERRGHRGRNLMPLVRGTVHVPGQAGNLPHDRAAIISPSGERALRTPAWYARFTSPESAELYAKPDDRWEINDVTRRCPEVVEAMRLALGDFEAVCRAGHMSEAPWAALDDLLVDGRR